jgi:hypothetical protein
MAAGDLPLADCRRILGELDRLSSENVTLRALLRKLRDVLRGDAALDHSEMEDQVALALGERRLSAAARRRGGRA